MQRNGVMDAGSDAGVGQLPLDPLSISDADDVEVMNGSRPGRDLRKHDGAAVGELLAIGLRVLPPLLVPGPEMTKLDPQHTSLNGVEPAVVPLHAVDVLLRLAMVAQHLATPGDPLVVCRDRACLAARSEVLAGIKTERRRTSHRSCRPPPAVFSRKVLGAVCLAGIFDHGEVVLGR